MMFRIIGPRHGVYGAPDVIQRKNRIEKDRRTWISDFSSYNSPVFVGFALVLLCIGWNSIRCSLGLDDTSLSLLSLGSKRSGTHGGCRIITSTVSDAAQRIGASMQIIMISFATGVGIGYIIPESWLVHRTNSMDHRSFRSFALSFAVRSALVSVACAPELLVFRFTSIPIAAIGILLAIGCHRMLTSFRIDDVMCIVPCHATCGIWSALCVGALAERNATTSIFGSDQGWGFLLGVCYVSLLFTSFFVYFLAIFLFLSLSLFFTSFFPSLRNMRKK